MNDTGIGYKFEDYVLEYSEQQQRFHHNWNDTEQSTHDWETIDACCNNDMFYRFEAYLKFLSDGPHSLEFVKLAYADFSTIVNIMEFPINMLHKIKTKKR